MKERIKIDEILIMTEKMVDLKMTDVEFEEFKNEIFKKIEEKFMDLYFPPSWTNSFISVAIGKLMAVTNELYGGNGVLKISAEYNVFLNDLLLEQNERLRAELMGKNKQ